MGHNFSYIFWRDFMPNWQINLPQWQFQDFLHGPLVAAEDPTSWRKRATPRKNNPGPFITQAAGAAHCAFVSDHHPCGLTNWDSSHTIWSLQGQIMCLVLWPVQDRRPRPKAQNHQAQAHPSPPYRGTMCHKLECFEGNPDWSSALRHEYGLDRFPCVSLGPTLL